MYVLYSAIDVMHTHYWVNCLLHMYVATYMHAA